MSFDEKKKELWFKLFGTVNTNSLADFKKYHHDHPEIFQLFRKYSNMMHATGRQKYSAKCIMERIRWDQDMQYDKKDFKISNSMTSLYVRLLIWTDPIFANFFQLKKIRGAKKVMKKDLPDSEVII